MRLREALEECRTTGAARVASRCSGGLCQLAVRRLYGPMTTFPLGKTHSHLGKDLDVALRGGLLREWVKDSGADLGSDAPVDGKTLRVHGRRRFPGCIWCRQRRRQRGGASTVGKGQELAAAKRGSSAPLC